MPTITIGNNTGDTYSGTEDAMIKQTYPTYNYGSRTTLEAVKYATNDHTHTLLKFTGLINIPSNAIINNAVLYIYQTTTGPDQTYTFRKLLHNWIEGTQDANDRNWNDPYSCCWNEYGAGNAWTTAGGLSNGNDRSSTITGQLLFGGVVSEYKSFTSEQLILDIQNFVNYSSQNYRWHIERTDSQDDSTYEIMASSEGADYQRPYLEVTYELPPAGRRFPRWRVNKYLAALKTVP